MTNTRLRAVAPSVGAGLAATLCRGLIVGLALVLTGVQAIPAQDSSAAIMYPMDARYNIRVPMRDGVTLSADVFRPRGNSKHPAIMIQTPYNNDSPRTMEQAWSFVKRGYAYVAVDVRGRYDSDGEFRPFRDGPDGSDVLNWIAKQPWSNGKVATRGASYSGKTQWEVAKQNNPHHTAILSYVSPADDFRDASRYNGVPKLDLMFTWMMGMYGRVNQSSAGWNWGKVMQGLPLNTLDSAAGRDIAFWRAAMEHDRLDDYWMESEVTGFYDRFDIPSFNVTGWYEGQLKGQVQNYVNSVKTSTRPSDHMLIVGPWLHSVNRDQKIGERDAGPGAIIDLDGIESRWVDSHMLGASDPGLPNVLYFLPVKNEWRAATAWPIPGTQFTSFYLSSGGKANTLNGDGKLLQGKPPTGGAATDSYTYDPADPVMSFSSRTAGARGGLPQGSVDNRKAEERQDVLVYTSEPLKQGMEITGPVRGTVYISSDVVDTDITMKLLDVYPDGRALNLAEGIARAKYRNSYSKPELMTPGQVYKIDVELFPTSNYFEAGHSIRIEIASSDFPNFARNLNTENSDTGTAMKVAHTKIHHTKQRPSAIVLPVVPSGASRVVTP